jgi:hypothetical protein
VWCVLLNQPQSNNNNKSKSKTRSDDDDEKKQTTTGETREKKMVEKRPRGCAIMSLVTFSFMPLTFY